MMPRPKPGLFCVLDAERETRGRLFSLSQQIRHFQLRVVGG